jgi:hypothetical protein
VVNQWIVAVVMWGLMLGPTVFATWWAHHRRVGSPEIWLVPVAVLMAISIVVIVLALVASFVSAARQLRGHEPREPWLRTTYQDESADSESLEIPKVW